MNTFNMLKFISLFTLIMFFSGCGLNKVSLTHKPRLLHFSTPETSGGWGNANATISASFLEPEYRFGSLTSFSLDPNSITINEESTVYNGGRLNLALWVGLMERLDIYVDDEFILGLKYQIIGSPTSTSEEGFKMSLAGQFGESKSSDSAGNSVLDAFFDSLFGSDPTVSFAESTTKVLDFSSNLGYRYDSKNIIYLNTFINENSFSGKIHSEALGLSRSVTEGSKSFGLLMGYQYTTDSNNFFIFELGIARTLWGSRGSINSTPAGISYGSNW